MADQDMAQPGWGSGPEDAFQFSGHWKEYLPIAASNLLLTIVTLGIYRFWATTRTRRYLWSHSRFIDDPLEWTGTGKELFIGFLMVSLLFGAPFLILNFGLQIIASRGHPVIAGLLSLASYILIFYLIGVARFRTLRYRLSRSLWHGIRGGSNDPGFAYGMSYIWKNAAGTAALGLLRPWATISLWNQRWRQMSFGPHAFQADAKFEMLMPRYLLLYLIPFLLIGLVIAAIVAKGTSFGGVILFSGASPLVTAILYITVFLAVLAIICMLILNYYAAYLRETIQTLSLGGLEFTFDATSDDWLALFFGDVALLIGTLGLGFTFLGYRHWKFFITHLGASGEIRLDELTQSETTLGRQGEGLADAFDIGAL